jgi:hypothetical protein
MLNLKIWCQRKQRSVAEGLVDIWSFDGTMVPAQIMSAISTYAGLRESRGDLRGCHSLCCGFSISGHDTTSGIRMPCGSHCLKSFGPGSDLHMKRVDKPSLWTLL